MLTTQHIPAPQSYYASPLLRCLSTASLTFSALPVPPHRPVNPLIKENLREANGAHTCDRRSSKSVIREKYPDWRFEEDFKEEDTLWKADLRESDAAQDQRAHAVLSDILGEDKNTWISISSHSGQIAAALRGMFLLIHSDTCL
jgi:broad specificity phosphatase PhoE